MTTDAPPKGHYKLFSPLALGDDLVLANRVLMSPMTRARADAATHVPGAQAATYYAQRASAGLVITEATAVSTQGYGWYGSPGMYTDDQERAWKEVVDAVHARRGKIFMQLWHMGRRAHSSFNGGHQVVSASATASPVNGQLKNAAGEPASFETARELDLHEIQSIVNDFEHAATRAKRAGFDGIDIHGANGYLVDQFLQSTTNQRTDKYGGSVANRTRFLLDVVGAVANVFAPHRIGVRLSPNGAFGGMGSSDNHGQFLYTAAQLGGLGIGYMAVLGDGFGVHDKGPQVTLAEMKQAFGGLVVATVGFTRDSAEGAIGTGTADAVAFGRAFLANPDLVERFLHDWPLNEEAPMDVWYDHAKGEQGYTSYVSYKPQ